MKKTVLSAALLTTVFACSALAQTYPAKPIRLIVPYAPGGATDVVARLLAERAAKQLNSDRMIVENRPGAGSAIGMDFIAAQAPDGYTVGITSSALPLMPLTNKEFKRDPIRDFSHITMLTVGPMVLAVSPGVTAKNMTEFISWARQNRGKVNLGTTGVTDVLAGELLKQRTGIDIVVVPYKGGAPAVTALAANEIQMVFQGVASINPQLQGGRVRALAVTSAQPTQLVPGVPAVAAELPGFDVTFWFALSGPAGMPKTVVQTLNSAFNAVLKDPEVVKQINTSTGTEALGSTPDGVDAQIRKDASPMWQEILKKAGLG